MDRKYFKINYLNLLSKVLIDNDDILATLEERIAERYSVFFQMLVIRK